MLVRFILSVWIDRHKLLYSTHSLKNLATSLGSRTAKQVAIEGAGLQNRAQDLA